MWSNVSRLSTVPKRSFSICSIVLQICQVCTTIATLLIAATGGGQSGARDGARSQAEGGWEDLFLFAGNSFESLVRLRSIWRKGFPRGRSGRRGRRGRDLARSGRSRRRGAAERATSRWRRRAGRNRCPPGATPGSAPGPRSDAARPRHRPPSASPLAGRRTR